MRESWVSLSGFYLSSSQARQLLDPQDKDDQDHLFIITVTATKAMIAKATRMKTTTKTATIKTIKTNSVTKKTITKKTSKQQQQRQ